jgi:hypothetical protein
MGKVYLPTKAPWLAEFTAEMLTFPAGKHDDMVDAFGLIGRMLDDMVPAMVPKVDVKKTADGYRKPETRDSWRTLT